MTGREGASEIGRIGFVGLGNMGGRMSARIVDAGRKVHGFDPIPAAGTKTIATASAAAAATGSDLVLLSLPNSSVVERVVLGEEGILGSTHPGQVVVDLSTSDPESTRRIAELYRERGAAYLDAGISGGAAAAENGSLTLMVGGDEDALELVRPVLETFSAKIVLVGPSGAGHTTKILNNFLNAVALSATSEVMVAAKKSGLDLEKLLVVLNESSGVNFATLNRFPKIIHGDYLKGGLTNTLMLKDLTLYVELLATLGVASLNAAGPVASFGLAQHLGYADEISNTVVDAIGDVSGGTRLCDGEK